MATPVLIDTDMGIDDAVAVCMAMGSGKLDVRAMVGVGGNVSAEQATRNIGRIVTALEPARRPVVACGVDQPGDLLQDRTSLHGEDGLGLCDLHDGTGKPDGDFLDVYRKAISNAKGELHILALGPLTNLDRFLREAPECVDRIKGIHISGGAVWAKGDVRGLAEFNFHRDPTAAARVLSSGLPINVTPLDVAALVCVDESHVAHLAASGSRAAQVAAKVMRYSLDNEGGPGFGKAHIHDVLTVGAMLWPGLFLKTKMRLDIVTAGPEAGRCRPQLGGDSGKRIDLLTAVNALDFLENILESLCHEAFVV